MTARRVRAVLGLGALVALLAVATAGAGTRGPAPKAATALGASQGLDVRDTVITEGSASSDRKLRRGGTARYPVGDGQGRTVAISVTPLCSSSVLVCNAADPQAIATFLGTLPHRDEIGSLVVQVTADSEISVECGTGAQACYFPVEERMLISGNDTTSPDGATREFVLAHEYGHHVANNRNNTPFSPTISFGTKYWTTYERVCEGVVSGIYFPGDQAGNYFNNPGEAFAEAYAFNRFPASPVQWAWIASLKPDTGSFAAIQRDALDPWTGPSVKGFGRRFGRGGKRTYTRVVKTPLDGTLELNLKGTATANVNLSVRDEAGRVIAKSTRPKSTESARVTICGGRQVTVLLKRAGRGPGKFNLKISRP